MNQYFPAYEIADLAAQFEEAGAEFYSRLARSTDDGRVKKILLELAREEVEHRQFFSELGKSAKENKITAVYPMEIYYSIQTMMKILEEDTFHNSATGVFPLNLARSIEIAINLEERSIETYGKMRVSLEAQISDLFLKIIEEEKRHLANLEQAREYLESQKGRGK